MLISQYKLKDVGTILMVAGSDSLLGLKMQQEGQQDVFLECFRRIEFVVYLLMNAEVEEWQIPKVVQSAKINFKTKSGDATTSFKMDQKQIQRNFINLASVYGFLGLKVDV